MIIVAMSKQSGKDKEKSFQEKMKQFFKQNKGSGFTKYGVPSLIISDEVMKELSKESPPHVRLKAMKGILEMLGNRRVDELGVAAVWTEISDLLQPNSPVELRHELFRLLGAMLKGQQRDFGMLREYFFNVIRDHRNLEDTGPLLELFKILTENGKNILHFEEDAGKFILDWFPEVIEADLGAELLAICINLIKFNVAHLEEDVVSGLVRRACSVCCRTNSEEDITGGLSLLDAVVRYWYLPCDVLISTILLLTRTVGTVAYCYSSWTLMRNLLCTHLGHNTVNRLCEILLNPTKYGQHPQVVRGAVFFIHMGLWGPKRVPALKDSHFAVLDALSMALECNHPIVAFEVAQAIKNLVEKEGRTMLFSSWNMVINILRTLLSLLDSYEGAEAEHVRALVHDNISDIEKLVEDNVFKGDEDELFNVISCYAATRPEESVVHLIKHRAKDVRPPTTNWLHNLNSFLDLFFKSDQRTNIRALALSTLDEVIYGYRYAYEEDLLEKVVLPQLSGIYADLDKIVRQRAVRIFVDIILYSSSKKCIDILHIMEKVINRPFETEVEQSSNLQEVDVPDIFAATSGLIEIFKTKVFTLPSCLAIKSYEILIQNLQLHYDNPKVFYSVPRIRYLIFQCFLRIRADAEYYIGFGSPDVNIATTFSPYLVLDCKPGDKSMVSTAHSPTPPSAAYPAIQSSVLSVTQGCMLLVTALKKEKDWSVLQLILDEMPRVLQNRALTLSRSGQEIDFLAKGICTMVNDVEFSDHLYNRPDRFPRFEFLAHVLPVLSALASYHRSLEPTRQKNLIQGLYLGLNSRSAATCIEALTVCCLEMKHTMYKYIAEILLELTKISAVKPISIPILEFLSTLIRLPKVYANFVEDQYMTIFAIALPYTNPFKFSPYTVALAHHVIAMWFLKCRLPFRRDFVQFITKGLEANILGAFAPTHVTRELENEDSSNRRRSASLNEQGMTKPRLRKDRGTSTQKISAEGALKNPLDDAMLTFHKQLNETCVDLLARYTFSTCVAQPKRSDTMEQLMKNGHYGYWLLGNKLVTITTSGCVGRATKDGYCDHCYQMCCNMEADFSSQSQENNSNRRRWQSEIQPKKTLVPGTDSYRSTKDDIGVRTISEEDRQGPLDRIQDSLYPGSREVEAARKISDTFQPAGLMNQEEKAKTMCACWCQGWAEIYVRRPTGNISWMMWLENLPQWLGSSNFIIPDISFLGAPESLIVKETEDDVNQENMNEVFEEGGRGIPIHSASQKVRRTNSSPEVMGSWKEKFLEMGPQISSSPGKEIKEPMPESPKASGGRMRRSSVTSMSSVQVRLPQSYRDRSNTGPSSPHQPHPARAFRYEPARSTSVTPSFIFLQLFSNNSGAVMLPQNETVNRAIRVLDLIPPYETHKIGVIYVGPGQAGHEAEILSNEFGSMRYVRFIQGLGELIKLDEVNPVTTFLGGLDQQGQAGKFAYIWHDDVMQVIFHIATLMPNKEGDVHCLAKKRHIGNDSTLIVYNDSGVPYDINTIRGQFCYGNVVIEPLEHGSNLVKVVTKPELSAHLNEIQWRLVSDQNLPVLSRQMALHANLAALVYQSCWKGGKDLYASNWLERLRQLRKIKNKMEATTTTNDDFTNLVTPAQVSQLPS